MNVTSLSFPYGESIQWFCADNAKNLPASPLKEWLLAPGSLTQKLKTCCDKFEVKILGEGQCTPLEGEYPKQNTVWVREVLLCLDSVPWVFARTLIPQSLLSTRQADFLGLGTRPLGELLFSQDSFIPGRIEIAQFDTDSRLAQLAQSLAQNVEHELWGRRRYFHHDEEEMFVSEMFLPAAVQAMARLQP
ncbi:MULTISPECIES: chorismate--pyruvate lyase family protein [Shewanella]|uniref:chorismate--pyruvate lyase family protein n=1 Tax=Shewanella TaxID=22 RepID=UPI00002D54B6|nr:MULTISPECIES: chorismate lyase [Shewanella]KPN77245.1 chorismate--pyruvate lyase [Shewanella sp. Sh95]MDH1626952.1 chorismate lyase [Shewanella xiamenensis]MDV5246692.1 chorismate lyase [Shewanella xiamenensis]ODR85108.1 chorismate--pyruvate lyase [Shewanella xiamenensis]